MTRLPEEVIGLAIDAVSDYPTGVPHPDSLLYEQIVKALGAALPAIYADLRERARAAAWAVHEEIDGPLGRASTDEEFKKMSPLDQDAERFRVGLDTAMKGDEDA